MMRFRAFLLITLPSVLGLPILCGAQTTTIDFDHTASGTSLSAPAGFSLAQPLTSLYAPLGLVVAGPPLEDGPAILNQDGNFGIGARSGRNFLAFNHQTHMANGGVPRGPVDFSFATAISFFEIYVSGGDSLAGFKLEAFNTGGGLLGTQNVNSPSQGYSLLTFSSNAPIGRVRISETAGDPHYVMDDLTFTAVPEPAAVGLALTGLIAMLQLRGAGPSIPGKQRQQVR